ncbi:ABC transporter permease [Clostridium aminobutyricum]|uniref:ABC transporter permease n=1 Tax=Clostridium aminobutyricum TaxID=33953 RepID=A0A939D8Z1_CLOAM|nr:ABC transporter permease [Clostridium aminobutyricum]MBN7772908.1 ABC transporter permease [Clostridium aminobutyricum]
MKKNIFIKLYVLLTILFLYTPIAVLMVMGFNQSRYNSLPFRFSLEWYKALAQNTTLLNAATNSFYLAVTTGLICVILATLFILGMKSLSHKTEGLFRNMMMMPMSIPWLIMGLSMLLMIRFLDMEKSLFFVVIGHVVISLPYAMLVLQARIQAMDPALEEMSASLGASTITTFGRIIFPQLAPAMVAGGFLSFMISFDNFAISYFLMPAGISSLPIEIQSSIKFGFTPEINAISTIIIGISLICLAVVGIIMGSSLKSVLGGNK